jgi:hypothetical protein
VKIPLNVEEISKLTYGDNYVTIHVKDLIGRVIDLCINKKATIEQLKLKIQDIKKIPIDQMRIIFAGR